ncbi:hypothetical protein TURU_105946 [Turdus rufiventris]|nr:hypothetical protein TURU_105946 [Turdus rufiventris]
MLSLGCVQIHGSETQKIFNVYKHLYLLLAFPDSENIMNPWSVGPCLPELMVCSTQAGIRVVELITDRILEKALAPDQVPTKRKANSPHHRIPDKKHAIG